MEWKQTSVNEYTYPIDYLLEYYYDQVDGLLSADLEKPRHLQITQSTPEELISAHLFDPFCSKIHRKIDGWWISLIFP